MVNAKIGGVVMTEESFHSELEHIKRHISYPATKRQAVEACNNMMDVPAEDREWFSKNLPDRTYNSAQDLLVALLEKA